VIDEDATVVSLVAYRLPIQLWVVYLWRRWGVRIAGHIMVQNGHFMVQVTAIMLTAVSSYFFSPASAGVAAVYTLPHKLHLSISSSA
jgi:hypothetical protein